MNKSFVREIRENLGYNATWLPFVKMAVGDVGWMSGYEFRHVTSLEKLNIPFAVSPPGAKADQDYSSKGAVSIELKAKGQIPPVGSFLQRADAGIIVSFSRENAIVFRISGCQITRLDDQKALEPAIRAALDGGRWNREYVLISEVVEAKISTILVSNGSNAKVELLANAALTAAELNLINARAGLSIQREAHIGIKIVAHGGLTPLFKSVALKMSFFRPDVLRDGTQTEESNGLVDVEYDDFGAPSET